ncbi:MAG: hypothetical protein V1798_10290 [Pseudomonadota bacterium]
MISALVLLSSSLSLTLAKTPEHPSLRYDVTFSYRKEPDADSVVLVLDETFRNVSQREVVFVAGDRDLQSIKPESAFTWKVHPTLVNRPPAPKASDVIRLGPGKSQQKRSWFWRDAVFPIGRAEGANTRFAVVRDKAPITVSVCRRLRDQGYKKFLKKGEELLSGTVCFGESSFTYQIPSAMEQSQAGTE